LEDEEMIAPRTVLLSAAWVGVAVLSTAARATVVYVDDADPQTKLTRGWYCSNATAGYNGTGYSLNNQVPGPTATFTPDLATTQTWSVYARWTDGINRSANVPYTVNYAGGSQTVYVNQQINGGTWQKLGDFTFNAGTGGSVFLNSAGTTGYVIADAVAFGHDLGGRPIINSAPFTAYASSTISSYNRGAIHAVDGSGMDTVLEPFHAGTVNGADVNWLSASGDTTGWYKVDLGATHDLESMDVYNFSSTDSATLNRGIQTFDLYVSNVAAPSDNDFANNPEWTLIQSDVTLDKAPKGTNDAPNLVNFLPNGTMARWVALDITSNYGDSSYTGLGELRFYEVPEPTSLAAVAGLTLVILTRRKRRGV
jgi:hypothetical protein